MPIKQGFFNSSRVIDIILQNKTNFAKKCKIKDFSLQLYYVFFRKIQIEKEAYICKLLF